MLNIIDGYNVMHALEEGGIAAADLEEKRQSFIESVISYAATTGEETIIVFDSTVALTPESHRIPNTRVTICFASASESADIVIGKLVQQNLAGGGGGRIRVVSADWEVQKGAMQKRVERIPPRHYLAGQKKFEKKLANNSETGRIRWKLEHKLDVETLRKLEEMRRGEG